MVDDTEIDVAFARAIEQARRGPRGMSRGDLATEMRLRGHDLHVSAIGKIERGERRVTIGEAVALASILGLDLQSFLAGGDERAARLDLDRAARAFVSNLEIIRNEALGLRSAQAAVADAVASFDALGVPFEGGRPAKEVFAPVLAMGDEDGPVSVIPGPGMSRVVERYL